MHRRHFIATISVFLAGCDSGQSWFGPDRRGAARELYERAAQRDLDAIQALNAVSDTSDPFAKFYAALMLQKGYAQLNNTRAMQLYTQIRERFLGAKFNLALLLIAAPKQVPAGLPPLEQLLAEAADRGRVEPMLVLARLYERGQAGQAVNTALAIQWYERAITHAKDPRAELRLGALLQDGPRRADAYALLMSAAKAGYAEAQYRLAFMETDPLASRRWLVVAAVNDKTYARPAAQGLAQLAPGDAFETERQARMWAHAHRKTNELQPFDSPFEEP